MPSYTGIKWSWTYLPKTQHGQTHRSRIVFIHGFSSKSWPQPHDRSWRNSIVFILQRGIMKRSSCIWLEGNSLTVTSSEEAIYARMGIYVLRWKSYQRVMGVHYDWQRQLWNLECVLVYGHLTLIIGPDEAPYDDTCYSSKPHTFSIERPEYRRLYMLNTCTAQD